MNSELSFGEMIGGEEPTTLNTLAYNAEVAGAQNTWVNTNQNASDFVLFEIVYPSNGAYYATATLANGEITSKLSTDMDIQVVNGKIQVKQNATSGTGYIRCRGFN